MKNPDSSIRFGPAGIPIKCKGSGTLEGVKCCNELGLEAMEMQFVRGVRMKEEQAKEISKVASEVDVSISSHAPYFINMCSKKPETIKNSIRHIYSAAKMTFLAGGNITVIHPGYYQTLSKEEAYKIAKKHFEEVAEKLKNEKIKCFLGTENVGKKSQFGGLDEVLRIANEIDLIKPVIDFSHLVARGDYTIKTENDYRKLFELLEKELGNYVNNFHFQFQEVNYTEAGERNHLPLGSNNEPPYKPFMKFLAENDYSGTIICESPKLDIDALKMQNNYYKLRKR